MLRFWHVILPAIPASIFATVAAAQRVETTIDVGATGIRYADSIGTAAATLSPAVRMDAAHATLGLAGSISELGTNAWTAQAALDGSAFTPLVAALRGELAGNAGGSAHEDGTRTGQLQALARIHLMRDVWGVWIGGGAGRAWDGSSAHVLAVGDAGAWLRTRAFTALLSAAPTAVDDSMRYIDFALGARWVLAREEIGATLGARRGNGLLTGSTSWGSVSGVFWLTPHVGVVAGAGTYPPDIAQGFPNGRYVSIALRLDIQPRLRRATGLGAARATNEPPPRDSMAAARSSRVAQFDTESSSALRTIRVRAPGAEVVQLSGDMLNWVPITLTPTGDGWWTIALAIPAGAHLVSLRVDNGPWEAPPGLVPVTDEFGGLSGVLNVP